MWPNVSQSGLFCYMFVLSYLLDNLSSNFLGRHISKFVYDVWTENVKHACIFIISLTKFSLILD